MAEKAIAERESIQHTPSLDQNRRETADKDIVRNVYVRTAHT